MRRWNRQLVIVIAVLLCVPSVASAQWENSTHYGMNESQIGGNGLFNSTSGSYSINPATDNGGESLGATAVGNSSSTSYQTNAGFDTTAEPGLYFTIDQTSINFGNVVINTQNTAIATFHVRDYTSYGYAVTIVGSTPSYLSHHLTALTTDTAYNSTQEQFGVNTVRNTVAAVGANPVQNPAGFGFGVAGDGSTGTFGTTRPYTISDKWRFNSGETVASSPKTSGDTDFTMTFMTNVTSTTPGGTYKGSLALIATGTY